MGINTGSAAYEDEMLQPVNPDAAATQENVSRIEEARATRQKRPDLRVIKDENETYTPQPGEGFSEVMQQLSAGQVPGFLNANSAQPGENEAPRLAENLKTGYSKAAQLLKKITGMSADQSRIFIHGLNNSKDQKRTKLGVSTTQKQILLDPALINMNSEAVAEILLHEFLHSYAGMSEGTTHAFVGVFFPNGVQNAEVQGQKESVESVWKIAKLINKDEYKGLEVVGRMERAREFDSLYELLEEFYLYNQGFRHGDVKRVRKAKNPEERGGKIKRRGRVYNQVAEEAEALFRKAFPELSNRGDRQVNGRLGEERQLLTEVVDGGTDDVRRKVGQVVPGVRTVDPGLPEDTQVDTERAVREALGEIPGPSAKRSNTFAAANSDGYRARRAA